MTKEDVDQSQEEKSSPDEGSESEETSEVDELFEDDSEESKDDAEEESDKEESKSEESEESDKDSRIADLEKTVKSLEKGIKKAFSEKGREKEHKEVTPSDDLENLFFEQRPEAEFVSDDLKSVAEAKGISILKAWRQEKWLQEKATKISEEKKVEEESKSKISNPTSRAGKKTDFSKLKQEEISKLSNEDKVKYFDYMLEKEKGGK